MNKSFEEMERKELIAAGKLYKLEDECDKAYGKTINNAKNAELIALLNGHKAEANDGEVEVVTNVVEDTPEPLKKTKQVAKKATVTEINEDHKRKTKCIVNDTQKGQSLDESEQGAAFSFGWGNMMGRFTESINLDGNVQGITQAGIARLKEIQTPEFYHVIDNDGKKIEKCRMRPRFQINEMSNHWTEDEILALREKQRTRM